MKKKENPKKKNLYKKAEEDELKRRPKKQKTKYKPQIEWLGEEE